MGETDHRYSPADLANVMAVVRDPDLLTQIGPYAIDSLIGEGGMGAVYRAEQREPIHRTVAIKVIKLGMDTRRVIARFDAERQTLALMDHPNVATVLDAGATESGRPYFVMEFVDGEPITQFADRERLTVRQRLELFTQACDAVQHAHQKGIIHRDLKPSNILVTQKDGKPTVKVIDFGIAKATGDRGASASQTLATEAGQLLGTPEYMAPEQAAGDLLDVDTRTDVYALGVVLYELLVGELPFDQAVLRGVSQHEVSRIIGQSDPPRPSMRLTELGESANETARLRRTDLTILHQQLRRELEWIPLKAMRRERDERYGGARELAEDIANYLANRPLRAGPESRIYRTRKFLRRNKIGVGASATMLLLLLGGIAATSWQAIRATRAEARSALERDYANATLDFLTDDVLAAATPETIPDAKVRQQLVDAMIAPAAAKVGERFKDQPLVEASIRETIRSVLVKIGRRDLALPHAERALEIRRELLGADNIDTLSSMNNYASVVEKLGRASEAEPVYRETLERRRRLLGDDDPKTMLSLNNYAHVLWILGRYAEAEPLYKEALDRRRRVLGENDIDTVMSLNNYASVIESLGRKDEAEPLYRRALAQYRQLRGDDHPQTMMAISNYGSVLVGLNRHADAAAFHQEALERRRRVLGEDHPETLWSTDQYGMTLTVLERYEEAEPLLREALRRRRQRLGDDHRETLQSINNYAVLLSRTGHDVEAEQLAREVYERSLKNPSLGPSHEWTIDFANTYATCLDALNRHVEADAIRKRFNLTKPATAATTQSGA